MAERGLSHFERRGPVTLLARNFPPLGQVTLLSAKWHRIIVVLKAEGPGFTRHAISLQPFRPKRVHGHQVFFLGLLGGGGVSSATT